MIEAKRTGAVDILECGVPLIREYTSVFRACWERLFASGMPKIVVDMKGTPLIDSAGLEALLDLKDRCEEVGGSAVLARPTPLCQDILRVNGLNREFQIYSDYVQALGSFSK
jgi:anti-anti-sigma factor